MKRICLLLPLLAAGCGEGAHSATPAPPPSVITEARSFATGMGDPHALEVVSRPGVRSWLIVVTGNLVCGACSHPDGTPTITGHAASETWTPNGGTTTVSVTEHPPALRAGVTVTPVPLLTRVKIGYSLPWRRARTAAIRQCRGEARCRVVRAQPRIWVADVRRRLSCGSVSAGDYLNLPRACRALRMLGAVWHAKPQLVCACPAVLAGSSAGWVRGTIAGRRVDIPLDPCSLCDMGAGAERAAAVLTPV